MSKQRQTDKVSKSADSRLQQTLGATASSKEEDSAGDMECPVCLQKCVYPVQLPCEHVFCFLCVKGFMARSRSCALCRCELPVDCCERPHIIDRNQLLASSQRAVSSDGYQWFYIGASGWWQYEDRIANEIEEAYKKKDKSTIISVSGFQYVVDFTEMVQYQQTDPNRRRRIKRDVVTTSKKGVAGIPLVDSQSQPDDDKDDLRETSSESVTDDHGQRPDIASTTDDEEDDQERGDIGSLSEQRTQEVNEEGVTASSGRNVNVEEELIESVQSLSLEDSKKT